METFRTPAPTGRQGFFAAGGALAAAALALAVLVGACTGVASTPAATAVPTAQPTPARTAQPSAPPTATPQPTAGRTPASTPTPAGSAAAFPVRITDDEGTTIELPAEPQRIVSLTPAVTETLYAIGAGDRVVGKVEDIANFPPEAADVPVVGTFAGVDVEQIVASNADLIFAGGSGGTPPDTIEQLRGLGLPVVVLYADDIGAVLRDIELVGEATGNANEAADLTASMRAAFDQVEAATSTLQRPRVFYETGDQPAIYGVADDSFVAAMIELAGGDVITTGSTTNWEMPLERLVEADPEVILLGDAAYGVTAEAVARRSGWGDLSAVKAGAIRPIDDIIVTRPGPRLAAGLQALVAAIHPDVALPAAT
jgi:iron complex transport system substrate-binding protein